MKTLLLAEYKKLHRSKLIFLLVFALIMTLGVVFLQGQFTFSGEKYIDTFGWYILQVHSLTTYFVLPSLIALFGGYIICREEQEDVLKSLRLIPIDESNMITAKMIITLLGSIFVYLILFMVSLIIEAVLHLNAVNMSEVVHYFVVYVLTGIGVFMAISPIIAFVGLVKRSYWIALIIAEIYSFIGIFFASKEVVRAIYPISSVFVLSGLYKTPVMELLISIIVNIGCCFISHRILKKMRVRKK
ncbi:TPA: ABC transporter permease [Streptococcus agalactiae]|nr:ABC transporter permease [Streptococcus agalactiae]HER8256674.1 ABC transporter permease [Streptococcus pyogenes]HEO3054951.1 ABC transporter permease [Streptococcus agalactiae]HEO5469594.1 ABC transporter permease [Streptococcus agalactiae]HEO5470596.1 ABC transporter permease [Streptococcus agalactiae]